MLVNTRKMVTITMTNNRDEQIVVRRCSQRSENVTEIFAAFGARQVPFEKKFVVPLAENEKRQLSENEISLPP